MTSETLSGDREIIMDKEWAGKVLRQHHIRLTEARLALLQVMANTEVSLEAKELFEEVKKLTGEPGWLSTVYRNLEIFAGKGLISSVNTPGSESIYYRIEKEGHTHYAICTQCRKTIPLSTCPLHEVEEELSKVHFTPTEHRLEVYGVCKDCQSKIQATQTEKAGF